MDKLHDRTDEHAIKHKNFYMDLAPELVPALRVKEQRLFVRAFQWYMSDGESAITNGRYFSPLLRLYETPGVSRAAKWEATHIVQEEVLEDLAVSEGTTSARGLFYAYATLAKPLLNGAGISRLEDMRRRYTFFSVNQDHRHHKALAADHIRFVAKHLLPADVVSPLPFFDEEQQFWRAMKYIKDPEDRKKVAIYQLKHGCYNGVPKTPKAQQRLLDMFPSDAELEDRVAYWHKWHARHIADEKCREERSRANRIEWANDPENVAAKGMR